MPDIEVSEKVYQKLLKLQAEENYCPISDLIDRLIAEYERPKNQPEENSENQLKDIAEGVINELRDEVRSELERELENEDVVLKRWIRSEMRSQLRSLKEELTAKLKSRLGCEDCPKETCWIEELLERGVCRWRYLNH